MGGPSRSPSQSTVSGGTRRVCRPTAQGSGPAGILNIKNARSFRKSYTDAHCDLQRQWEPHRVQGTDCLPPAEGLLQPWGAGGRARSHRLSWPWGALIGIPPRAWPCSTTSPPAGPQGCALGTPQPKGDGWPLPRPHGPDTDSQAPLVPLSFLPPPSLVRLRSPAGRAVQAGAGARGEVGGRLTLVPNGSVGRLLSGCDLFRK